MAKFVRPYFIEVHSADCGHAFLPGSYEDASKAVAVAQSCQKETDPTTSYLVSDRNQDIVWEGQTNG